MIKLLRYSLIIISYLVVAVLVFASVFALVRFQNVANNPATINQESIEYFYRDHLILAYLHIVPGLIFLFLGGYQLIPYLRRLNYKLHRILGKIFLILSAIIFITAIILGLFFPFGDWLESITTLIFGIFLLFCVYKAYNTARNKIFLNHRNWVIRIYFVALSVSTIRGLIGIFGAFDYSMKESFGLAFLIGFLLHTLIVELYIKYLIGPFKY